MSRNNNGGTAVAAGFLSSLVFKCLIVGAIVCLFAKEIIILGVVFIGLNIAHAVIKG